MSSYEYPLTDFSGFNSDNFVSEIQASAIVTALDNVSADETDVTVLFKATLSAGDETALTALVAAHDSTVIKPVPKIDINGAGVDADGNICTSSTLPSGSETVKISHNFCDKTTWFSNATLVTDEVATEDTGTQFSLANTDIIDAAHGKMYREDEDLTDYLVVVKVNDVVKTEDEYDGDTHDYSINYATGVITFATDQTGNTVKVTYYYATDSIFKIVPESGKKLQIIRGEVQFISDFDMKDAVQFQVYHTGLAQVVQQVTYKSFMNLAQEAFGNFPELPDVVGNRKMGGTLRNMPFAYTAKTDIVPGLEVWIRLKNDTVCGGKHASVTLHCAVADAT